MAKGFKPTKKKVKENTGYETIFEKITRLAGGESQSYEWYKRQIDTLSRNYKLIVDERRDDTGKIDERDENKLRFYPLEGRLFFFDYEAKSKYLPYYDKFPLVYVIKTTANHFYGANLHYLAPKKRVYAINAMKEGKINVPAGIVHKYLRSQVKDFFLDLHQDEWETAILLPVDDFVKGKSPYDREEVWRETNKSQKKFKGILTPKEYSGD